MVDKKDKVIQGTGPQPFDVTGASSVSYITSFLPGEKTPTKMTEAQLNKMLFNMTPQERISYATKLKAAGYRVGPINGAVTKDLRQSWLNVHSDLQTEIQSGQALDLNTFLVANVGPSGSGSGSGRAGTYKTTAQINDTAAAALINSIVQDLQDQDATPQQIAKYTQQLRKAQAANPTRTTYDAAGNSTVTGGIDTQQFLTEKIKSTPEAKTNRATDAYSIMMQELGGLR
jgi:hypothetical protein